MTTRTLVLAGAVVHFAAFLIAHTLGLSGIQRVLLEPVASALGMVRPESEPSWYTSSLLILSAASLLWGTLAAGAWNALRRVKSLSDWVLPARPNADSPERTAG